MQRVLFAVGLAACAPAAAELRAPVDETVAERLGVPGHADVATLLAKPLDEQAAVRVALASSPRLAVALDELGIAGSELATALGVGPVDVEGMFRFGDHTHELEIDAIQNVIGLVTAPKLRAAAHADVAAARAAAAAMAIALAARVEVAFHDLIAAQQAVELREQALSAADAAATLRERMYAAGNTTDLALARDREAREEARIDLDRANAAVAERREALNALMGLSGTRTTWTAQGRLPDPPEAPPALDDLEPAAVAASLELAAGRARTVAAADRVGAARIGAWLPELGVGASVIELDGRLEVGPAIRIGLPIFDQRAGDRARAAAEQLRAGHALAADATELRARARAVRAAALEAYGEAKRLHDDVLPLRQQIAEQTLLHYNAMDADPFEVIAARRDLADAGQRYVDALRRYANAMSEAAALRRGATVRPDVDLP